MATRKVLKITPVLVALNILVLLIIVVFYTARLIKYYKIENGHKKEDTTILVDEIKKHQSMLDETKGLVLDDKTGIYTYKGEVNDNYLFYSGMMYRIVSVDKNENIKLVSEDNVTLIYPGFNNGYEKSYVTKWLNSSDEKNSGIYENNLMNAGGILENSQYCEDAIDDLSKIECNNSTDKYKITLLSLYDYKMAGGKTSYLNNNTLFNLGSLNSMNANYYVTEDGEISLNQRSSRAISIRPVITINSGTELISGTGKKSDPYIIEKHDVDTLGDTYVNSIVKIDNNTYKVVELGEDKVKLAGTDVLKDGESNLLIAFSNKISAYQDNTIVGKYLNGTFLDSLSVKDSVVSSDWYNGTLTLADLDYSSIRNSKSTAKVGMLTIGDMYVNEVSNVFTTLRGMEASNIINVINESGNLYADQISSKYNVRAAFYLKSDLKIKSGSGTMDSPYELGVNDEKEKEK